MLGLYSNRTHFYQWDLNQKVKVEDNTIKEIHFDNGTENALVCAVYEYEGQRVADVPNILLQNYMPIKVYAFCGECVRYETIYDVEKRRKPADYVYTETEVKRYEDLESRIVELENYRITSGVNTVNGKAGNVVLNAADVGALPDTTIIPVVPSKVSAFANDAEYLTKNNLSAYYTKTETESAIDAAIDNIPATDLSNYYTKTQTNTAINNAKQDLTPYAKKTDLTGLATETYVNTQITTAKPDLTPYAKKTDIADMATQTYVNDAIGAIPATDLSNYYTKAQTNTQISTALTPYAKKTELPTIEGLATETYVNNAIDAIPETDLSNYYTKTQTNTAINNAKPDLTPYATKANSENWTFTLKDGTTLTKRVVLA